MFTFLLNSILGGVLATLFMDVAGMLVRVTRRLRCTLLLAGAAAKTGSLEPFVAPLLIRSNA